jgi:preprotein translocase subunit SecE
VIVKAVRQPEADKRRYEMMKKLGQLLEKMKTFLNEVRVEMQKVTWPSRNEIMSYTVVVLVTVLILSTIIWAADNVLGRVLKVIFG